MRVIEIIADASNIDTLTGIAEQHQVAEFWYGDELEDGRRVLRMLVDDASRQAVVDALQSQLGGSDTARIIILPVDAVLPRKEDAAEADKGRVPSGSQTREELYNGIERGARLDSTFLMLVFLSTIVASIGLIENNIAVIVGAMVIAPLLGPLLAFGLGTALGDVDLMRKSAITGAAGIGLAIALSVAAADKKAPQKKKPAAKKKAAVKKQGAVRKKTARKKAPARKTG